MIDTHSVRNRLLELAIRGNLVEQCGDIESVETNISRIIEQRKELIKQGLTKKPRDYQMIEEDIFDIPDSWKWVPLGDICILLSRGKSPKYSEVDKYPVFAQKCNQPNGLALEKALFLDETTLSKWPEYFRLTDGDIVINSTGTGTVGRVGYYSTETLLAKYPFMVPDSHVTVARTGNNISSRYLYYVLRSPSIQKIMFNQFRGSTNQKEFYIDSVYSIPIPLPCFEEQNNISQKLDTAFSVLDTIDKAQEKYSADSQILKAKLITAGIQGKLTKQLESDGTAEELYQQIQGEKQKLIKEGKIKKEKPLPPISPDEIPFEIPQNWMWVRLSSIIDVRDGTHDSPKYHSEGIPLITSKNLSSGKLDFENVKLISYEDAKKINERSYVENGDILFAMIGTIGNPVIVNTDKEFCIKNVALFKQYKGAKFNMNYLYYYLLMEQYEMKKITLGGLQPFVSLKLFRSHVIPLPPLAEQKRIADVLERVLGEIDNK